MKRDWKLRFLPFLYRECPSGNAHWIGNHICYCCEGQNRNWTYVWRGSDKGWVPVDYALDITANKQIGISWSGQLTPLDLIWNGIRTGLLIAIILGLFFYIGMKMLIQEGELYQKNVQDKHERITNSME